MKKAISIITLLTFAILVASPVFSAEVGTKFTTIEDMLALISRLINYLFTALLITAVIFIIISAFGWLTSGGDSAKTQNSRNMLMYALIAVAVGALAKGLVYMVGSLLQVDVRF